MTTRSSLPAERAVQLDIQILGRDYKVACKEHEREELLAAVGFLDKRMREIRDAGKISGADRIAVMAALNLANELLRERRAPAAATTATPATRGSSAGVDGPDARRRIVAMQAAIDQTMAGQEKLL
jgi:cell division protein ZapA